MTKTTYQLYRQSPKIWADLPYIKALKVKIELAKLAMSYYRQESSIKHYQASEKALEFNRFLLSELEE